MAAEATVAVKYRRSLMNFIDVEKQCLELKKSMTMDKEGKRDVSQNRFLIMV